MRCLPLGAGVASLCAALGCAPAEPAATRSRELVEILIQDPVEGCDPRQATHVRTSSVTRHVHEGLVAYDPIALQEGRVVLRGGLAESWDVEDEGRRIVFHLRAGWRFHDDGCFPGWTGREVVADDALFSLTRWVSAGTPEPRWRVFQSIRGAAEYRAGRAEAVAGLRAADARTLAIELERADPFLLHALAGPAGWIVAREAVAAYGDDLGRHPVGIGPYRLARMDPAEGLTLVRHDGYGLSDPEGRALPRNEGLRFRYGDPVDALLGSRGYDLLFARPGRFESLSARMKGKGLSFATCTKLNTIFYAFDFAHENPWRTDARLRRALSLLLPRPTGRADWIPAEHLLPPALRPAGVAPDDLPRQIQDPAAGLRAIEKLRAEGVTVPRTLRVRMDPYELADVEDWRAVFATAGIELECHTPKDAPPGWSAHLFRAGWIADVPDARDFYGLFWSRSPHNQGGFADARFDAAFESALVAGDASDLTASYVCMEQVLADEVPALWYRHERTELIFREGLGGWTFALNPLMRPMLEYVSLEGSP